MKSSSKTQTQAGGNGQVKLEQLDLALRDIEDLLQRALCPFILLGQTAKDIVDGTGLTGKRIDIGVERKHMTKQVRGTLEFYLKDKVKDVGKSFDYEPSGVPKYKTMPRIYVKVIERKWKFLKNKDFKFYMNSEYQIPNPFKNYWKAKGLVR